MIARLAALSVFLFASPVIAEESGWYDFGQWVGNTASKLGSGAADLARGTVNPDQETQDYNASLKEEFRSDRGPSRFDVYTCSVRPIDLMPDQCMVIMPRHLEARIAEFDGIVDDDMIIFREALIWWREAILDEDAERRIEAAGQ